MVKITTEQGMHKIVVSFKDFYVSLLDKGATLYEVKIKDNDENWNDLVLNYENINDYNDNDIYLGSCIGPYAGRIKNSKYVIDDKEYTLKANDLGHNLHSNGLMNNHNFDFKYTETKKWTRVTFFTTFESKDNKFPGNLEVEIRYIIYENKKIKIEIFALPDETTLCNITNHTYFNLSQNQQESILNHNIDAKCKYIYELEDSIPIKKINASNWFRNKTINTVLKEHEDFFKLTKGIDHPLVFGKHAKISLSSLHKVKIKSSYPSLVLYSLNTPSKHKINNLKSDHIHFGLAIEPQFVPSKTKDAILEKDVKYLHWITYKFE